VRESKRTYYDATANPVPGWLYRFNLTGNRARVIIGITTQADHMRRPRKYKLGAPDRIVWLPDVSGVEREIKRALARFALESPEAFADHPEVHAYLDEVFAAGLPEAPDDWVPDEDEDEDDAQGSLF